MLFQCSLFFFITTTFVISIHGLLTLKKIRIMEPNWIFVIIVIVAVISLVIFLIWRNQKDKKALMRKLIDEDKLSLPKESDTEVDIAD